jgi:hypothetical protein
MDAGDVDATSGIARTAKSCGPGAPMQALSFADAICEATVATKHGHWGDHV